MPPSSQCGSINVPNESGDVLSIADTSITQFMRSFTVMGKAYTSRTTVDAFWFRGLDLLLIVREFTL